MTKKLTREEAAALLAEVAREGISKQGLMTSWERELEEQGRERNRAEMERRLSELPPEDGKPKACPKCGKKVRVRRRAVERTFQSLWGTHTVRRDYHYCEHCKEGFYPRDEALKLPKEGALTEEVESRIADFAVSDVYEHAQARWRMHYRLMPVSENQFRQVARRLGNQLEQCQDLVLEGAVRPPPSEAPERLYVMSDGGMVPMRQGEWREVKVGVCFREENHLPGDRRTRGCISEARYTAVLGDQEEFKQKMRTALDAELAPAANEVVYLGDGAPGNWLLIGLLCPRATQILDWCHAVEASTRCATILLGENDPALPSWKERTETLLARGAVEELIAEFAACEPDCTTLLQRKALVDVQRYYRNNQPRMAYADFRERGLLIGSGPVESAHRHVIQARMKKAGQHWSERGGRQMARLRAAYRTAGPELFYPAIRWAHRTSQKVIRALPRPHKVDLRKRGMANR